MVSLVRWLKSRQMNWPYVVKINKYMSKEIVSSSVVPQGCNIIPLFILFVNDVTLALPPDSVSLFGDDATIFAPIHYTGDCMFL